MKKIWFYLNKPYPFPGNIRQGIISNMFIGLFVALFLITFQPFQINDWITGFKPIKLFGFGFISFLVPSFFNVLIPFIYKNSAFTESWTVIKEILTVLGVLVFIAFANMAYGHWLGVMPFGIGAYLVVFGITCLVGIFPVTIHVILKHNKLLKITLEQSKELNRQLFLQHQTILDAGEPIQNELARQERVPPIILNFVAENGKDSIRIELKNLLYIESADNYSTLVFLDQSKQKKHLLRSSLKRMESQLNDPHILRCHRTFIVNLLNVKNADGNAAGYRLFFYNSEDIVPVSRNYVQTVNEKLKNLNALV